MSKILVVDDSKTDQSFVKGLLSKHHEVCLADHGEAALKLIPQERPSLILTDMQMEPVDGFQLTSQVRKLYPHLPVILMTSHGSEEIAMQALDAGAASYTPKSMLQHDLLCMVQNVLSLTGEARSLDRLLSCMISQDASFEISNQRELIPPLVSYVQDQTTRLGICDQSDRIRIGIAIEEALVNAIYHGNLEVGSELRELDDGSYEKLIEERLNTEPFASRKVHVHFKHTRNEAVITISDEGPGFDPDSLPDPTDPANLERVSGRGLLLIKTFMDEVDHNSTGNEITLVKRAPAKVAS